MDPLSVTVSVASLLGTSIKIGATLKTLWDGSKSVDARVQGVLDEVEAFTTALELVKKTLEEDKLSETIQSTGHIGDHWKNLFICIIDGQQTLDALQAAVVKVNKSASVLDNTRKHLRFEAAAKEISAYQYKIRYYRDTIHLSIQTVILSVLRIYSG